jgi:parallel beta-helix repeat protein
MKKIVPSFILLFLALSLCCSLQFVGLVSANFLPAPVPDHNIEITEDGDVTGTDKIQRSGNLYTFTENIVGSIVIFRNGIVVDGAGYTLQGNGSRTGIWLQARSNINLKNMRIRNFTHGIEFTYGWTQNGCTNITISGNTITDNEHGISFWLFSGNNSVLGNTIANNNYGVYISHSPKNVFRNNQMTHNRYNLWVESELSDYTSVFINDIDASNTVDGKPIIYWVNEQDKTVSSDAGYVALVNCKNITVQNLALTNNTQGVLLVATDNSLITGNYVKNNGFGISFQGSFEHCFNNVISKNNITENTKDGIYSWGSDKTNITENSITNNYESGINFFESPNANIFGNAITGNNDYGIRIWYYSDNSRVYHNNLDNTHNAVVSSSYPNYWDNGSEGNYWSNYNGTDTDGDGIGDTPYIINENNQDNHPLMQPTVIPEFPSWIILLLLITATLVAIIYKKRLPKTPNQQSY